MSSIVEKLIAAHPEKQFVVATTKRDVFALLDKIRRTVEAMEEFTQFPEGPSGAILYALLKNASESCPDPGDFNYVHQGYEAALSTASEVLASEVVWFPGLKHRRE